jgi:predicted metalloprotease with PDZ domain
MTIFKFSSTAFLIGLSLTAGPALADSYQVSFDKGPRQLGEEEPQYRLAKVEAHLTPNAGRIGWVRSHNDTGLPNGWSTFVHRPRAFSADGSTLGLTYTGGGIWQVDGWESGEIRVTYTMQLQHDRFLNDPGENELAYARDFGVMWTGRALFVEGSSAEDIDISFDLPDGWKVTSPWKRAEGNGVRFRADNVSDLMNSAFMAGTHIEKEVAVAGGLARIAMDPNVETGADLATTTMNQYFPAFQTLFGDALTDTPLFIASQATFWGAGVMGRTISMSMGGPLEGRFANLASYIVAHEGYHLWNTSVRWRYDQSNGELEWIKEGFAEYYTFLTGVRVGATDEIAFLRSISQRSGLYLTALKERGIAEGGATKLSGGATSYNLVYSGGMAVATVLDAQIRTHSNGQKSLDDVVREIHTRYAREGTESFTLATLGQLFQEYGIEDTFVATYITGETPLPLAEALATYGLITAISEQDGRVTVRVSKDRRADVEAKQRWADFISRENTIKR